MKINVAVIFGCSSVEHEISIISAVQAMHSFNREKYNVIPAYFAKDGTLYTGDSLLDIDKYKDMKKVIVTPGLVELGAIEYETNKTVGKVAAEKCDILIFVGKKRSEPLLEGVKDALTGSPERVLTVDRFSDAVTLLGEICDENTVVLFENDLPDNYAG